MAALPVRKRWRPPSGQRPVPFEVAQRLGGHPLRRGRLARRLRQVPRHGRGRGDGLPHRVLARGDGLDFEVPPTPPHGPLPRRRPVPLPQHGNRLRRQRPDPAVGRDARHVFGDSVHVRRQVQERHRIRLAEPARHRRPHRVASVVEVVRERRPLQETGLAGNPVRGHQPARPLQRMGVAQADGVDPRLPRRVPRQPVRPGPLLAEHRAGPVQHAFFPSVEESVQRRRRRPRGHFARKQHRVPVPALAALRLFQARGFRFQRVEIALVARQRVQVHRGLHELGLGQLVRFVPVDGFGRIDPPPVLALDAEHHRFGLPAHRELPRPFRAHQVLPAEARVAPDQQRRVRRVRQRTGPRRPRQGVRHRIAFRHVPRHGVPRALHPRPHPAVLLLPLEQVAQPPLRLVQDVRDAVRPLRDPQLVVREIPRPHQVDRAQVVDDLQVLRPPVVVRRVVPSPRQVQPLAVRPVGGLLHEGCPQHLRRHLALLGREHPAHDVRVAGLRDPVRVGLLLGDAAAFLVEAAHVDAERRLRRAAPNPERPAPPHPRHPHVVLPFALHVREIHLVRVLARPLRPLLRQRVLHPHARRLRAVLCDLPRRRVHQLPARQPGVRLPRAQLRSEPRPHVGVLRRPRQVSHLVDLEQRARRVRIVLLRRLLPGAETRVDDPGFGLPERVAEALHPPPRLARHVPSQPPDGPHGQPLPRRPLQRVGQPHRNRPVVRVRRPRRPDPRVVRLFDGRVRIEEPQQHRRHHCVRPAHAFLSTPSGGRRGSRGIRPPAAIHARRCNRSACHGCPTCRDG